MKVKLKNGKRASSHTVLALEAALGFQLSDSFKNFLSDNDGAIPEANIFRISDRYHSGVNQFVPADKIANERTRIENLPLRAYPIAWAECGNIVFIDEDRDGAVYYWDHEVRGNPTELADNFGAFLSLLEPFDIKTVQLKPGQVKEAWIDPDFLKKLSK